MDLIGTRKAAALLMSLDPPTAAELLKAAEPDVITRIAVELASLDATAQERDTIPIEPVAEFFGLLRQRKEPRARTFVRQILETAVGGQKCQQLLDEAQQVMLTRDPFRQLRSVEAEAIAKALEGESAQVAALVLSELPAKKSAELLSLLDESIRAEAVRGMITTDRVSAEAKLRVANAVCSRLAPEPGEAQPVSAPAEDKKGKDDQLRKVAVLLRGLKAELRDELIESVIKRDEEKGKRVRDLMVVWEDIPMVSERPMQEALRQVDSRKIALALLEADEAIITNVRANLSERASGMLDEEVSLLSSPKAEDIESGREAILDVLRGLNAKGELTMEEG